MRRLASSALVAALACVAFPAAADPHPGHGPPSVYIADLKFQPDQLTVYTGDAVVWIWNGPDTNHSVTATDGSFDSDPGGSPNHTVGDAYSYTFNTPGTFTYACRVHSFMQGTITVKPLPNAPADPAPTATAPSIGGLRASPSRGGRALLRFTLSAAADVNTTIARASGGKVLREVDFSAKAGAVKRRVSFGRLRRGRYRVKVVAVDPSSGLASPAAKATLQVRR
jgi:plastocyanin